MSDFPETVDTDRPELLQLVKLWIFFTLLDNFQLWNIAKLLGHHMVKVTGVYSVYEVLI